MEIDAAALRLSALGRRGGARKRGEGEPRRAVLDARPSGEAEASCSERRQAGGAGGSPPPCGLRRP